MNLEFEYRIEGDLVTIVKYIGHQTEIVLPETIEGKSVVAIAEYAFVNQRNIRKLEFSRKINRIGSHAFYDCRGLEDVIFYDTICEVSDGAFKNCDSLHRVELHLYQGSFLCIKSLLEEFGQEMELWLNYHLDEDIEKACLIFPRFLQNYVEFTQARIINQETHGFGVHYREHLLESKIDYKGYDELFLLVSKVEDVNLCCKIAMARILYPYQVSAHIYPVYLQYLRDQIRYWLPDIVTMEQMEQLQQLERVDFFTLEVIASALHIAHELDKIEFVSYFMTLKQRRFPGVHKKFEL